METFSTTILIFPGRDCVCGNVTSAANPDTLAYFLNLTNLMNVSIFIVLYFFTKDSKNLSWATLYILAVLGVVCCTIMRRCTLALCLAPRGLCALPSTSHHS